MTTPHGTSSPSPGPSGSPGYGLIADAIYEYCRENHDPSEVLVQEHLLKPDIIPNKDLGILVQVCQHLVDNHLFKTHEIKGGGIGWKLATRENAENYKDLSRDEKMVYSAIDSSGTKGIWTKVIKERLNIHAKIVERAFKSLEGKGLIEPMKDVKFPGRKMFIKRGLKPNEEVTGGAWFTDGELDILMIDMVATVIEKLVGDKSWVEERPPLSPGTAERSAHPRRRPLDGRASLWVRRRSHSISASRSPAPLRRRLPRHPPYTERPERFGFAPVARPLGAQPAPGIQASTSLL